MDQKQKEIRDQRLRNWLCPACGSPMINANLKHVEHAVCSNLTGCRERLALGPLPKKWVNRNHALAAGIPECNLVGDSFFILGEDTGRYQQEKKMNRQDYPPDLVRKTEQTGLRIAVHGHDVILLRKRK